MTKQELKPSERILEMLGSPLLAPDSPHDVRRVVAVIAYLDEQHAAGQGEAPQPAPTHCRHGVSVFDRCVYCVADSSNDAAGAPIAEPPEPAPGSRELLCSGGCGKPSPRNPTAAVKYTCAACAARAAREAAPIAEPPAPEAGEVYPARDRRYGLTLDGEQARALLSGFDEALALSQVEALRNQQIGEREVKREALKAAAQSLADEQGKRVELSRVHANALAKIEKLTIERDTERRRRDEAVGQAERLAEHREALTLELAATEKDRELWKGEYVSTLDALTAATSRAEEAELQVAALELTLKETEDGLSGIAAKANARAEAAEGRVKELDEACDEAWQVAEDLRGVERRATESEESRDAALKSKAELEKELGELKLAPSGKYFAIIRRASGYEGSSWEELGRLVANQRAVADAADQAQRAPPEPVTPEPQGGEGLRCLCYSGAQRIAEGEAHKSHCPYAVKP